MHEDTVQAVARGETLDVQPKRVRAKGTRSVVDSWTRPVLDVHPAIKRMLDERGVDPRDVDVLSYTEVVIR